MYHFSSWSGTDQFQKFPDRDCFGNDIGSHDSISAEFCADYCQQLGNCTAFVLDHRNRMCWFKGLCNHTNLTDVPMVDLYITMPGKLYLKVIDVWYWSIRCESISWWVDLSKRSAPVSRKCSTHSRLLTPCAGTLYGYLRMAYAVWCAYESSRNGPLGHNLQFNIYYLAILMSGSVWYVHVNSYVNSVHYRQ